MNENKEITTTFVTFNELEKIYPYFTPKRMKYWIYHKRKSGLHKCLRKVGHCYFVNFEEFEEWINECSIKTKI